MIPGSKTPNLAGGSPSFAIPVCFFAILHLRMVHGGGGCEHINISVFACITDTNKREAESVRVRQRESDRGRVYMRVVVQG